MKLKTRFSLCTKPIATADDGDDLFSTVKTTPPSSTNSSLQSHTSLQTLPSVPSLQSLSLLDYTVTLTHSLFSSITLSSAVTSLSLSSTSSSKPLLYASSGHHINVYDPTNLIHLETFVGTSASTGAVKSIVFCNEKILTAHQDGKIRAWKVKQDNDDAKERQHKLVATLPTLSDRAVRFVVPKNHVQVRRHKTRLWVEHHDAVSCLAVKNSSIYSVSWDRTLKIWGKKGMRCQESVTAHDDAVNAVTVSNDGVVYTGSAEGRIKVWSRGSDSGGSGKHGLTTTLEKHKSAVNALTLSEDGTMLFSGACDRSILVWEREDTGNFMRVSGALRGHDGAILCLFNVSKFLISGSADRTVRIWRRGSEGKFCCLAVLTGHTKAVKCLAAKMEGEDGITVFSGGLDGVIKVWSIKVNSCHQ